MNVFIYILDISHLDLDVRVNESNYMMLLGIKLNDTVASYFWKHDSTSSKLEWFCYFYVYL